MTLSRNSRATTKHKYTHAREHTHTQQINGSLVSYVTTILNAMMGKQYKRSIKLSHQKLTVSEVRGSVKSTSIATNSSEFDSIRFDCGSSSTLRTKQKKKKNYNKSFDTTNIQNRFVLNNSPTVAPNFILSYRLYFLLFHFN